MFEEEVKKIIKPRLLNPDKADRIAQEICQLFEPKPEYDSSITQLPDPFEPKSKPKATYTLNCPRCGGVFESPSAFPQPQLCPECMEPKADKNRLLTKEERDEVYDTGDYETVGEERIALCQAQLAKDLKFEQARVERIFEEIETFNPIDEILHGVMLSPSQWQDLKK